MLFLIATLLTFTNQIVGVDGSSVLGSAMAMCGKAGCVAWNADGSAHAWTFYSDTDFEFSDVKEAHCGDKACVVVFYDGTVKTWGSSIDGGDSGDADLTDVITATCGGSACVAIKADRTAVAWGNKLEGGDASDVDLTLVDKATCGDVSCVAVKFDGTAVIWGDLTFADSDEGRNSYSTDDADENAIESSLTNIFDVSCRGACLAFKTDGTAVTWGATMRGGDHSSSDVILDDIVSGMCADQVCAVTKADGQAAAWGLGDRSWDFGRDIANVHCSSVVCVIVKKDGTVMTQYLYLGTIPDWHVPPLGLKDVITARCGDNSCIALKSDKTAVVWGENFPGDAKDLTNVAKVDCAFYTCLVRKYDGTVLSWGHHAADGLMKWPVSISDDGSSLESSLELSVDFAAGSDDGSSVESSAEFSIEVDMSTLPLSPTQQATEASPGGLEFLEMERNYMMAREEEIKLLQEYNEGLADTLKERDEEIDQLKVGHEELVTRVNDLEEHIAKLEEKINARRKLKSEAGKENHRAERTSTLPRLLHITRE